MSDSQDDSQKTEDPTSKRQAEAREKGQVGKSRELDHFFMLLAISLAVFIFGPSLMTRVKDILMIFVEAPHAMAVDKFALQDMLWRLAGQLGLALAPVIALLVIAGLGSSILQHGFLFAPDMLVPKWSKLSPLEGFKRLFSMRAMIEFLKGAGKIALVGAFQYWLMRDDFDHLEKYVYIDEVQLLHLILGLSLKLLSGILAMLAVIAGADFLYQKFQTLRDMRMSRQEIRDEHKQSEGDPMVKGRLRQLRVERARRRMMQEVPKADVIVTNPTHFAVALKYDQSKNAAPRVTAKGADLVAQRIRDLAVEHNVPIVQNPPLARVLYAHVDIDREVPPDYYKAVAEIISYVFKLRRGERADPPKPTPEVEAPPPP